MTDAKVSFQIRVNFIRKPTVHALEFKFVQINHIFDLKRYVGIVINKAFFIYLFLKTELLF